MYGLGYKIKKTNNKNKKLVLGDVVIQECGGIKDYINGDILVLSIIEAIIGITNNRKIMGELLEEFDLNKDCSVYELVKALNNHLHEKNLKLSRIDSYIVVENVVMMKYNDKIVSNLSKLFNISKDDICLAATTNDGIGAIGKGEALEVITLAVLETINKRGSIKSL